MALFGPMLGLSAAASWSMSFSASGNFIYAASSLITKVLLQNELRGDRIDRFFLQPAQLVLGFDGGVTLVHARHWQLETALQAPGEVFRLARHLVRVALRRGRQ